MILVKSILSQKNYITLNRILINKLGLEAAFLISIIADAQDYFESEWVYQTIDTVHRLTGLGRKTQDRVFKKLIDLGILEKKTQGKSAKRFFKLNEQKILDILDLSKTDKADHLDVSKMDKANAPDLSKTDNNKTNIYNKTNKEEIKNICGAEAPRGSTIKKEKNKGKEKEEKRSEEYGVYEAYQIFYYKITGKHTKLQFLSDTQRACKKIVHEYKMLKPDMSLGEFAYKVFGGNYLRLESMDTDHKLRISTASNYVGKNIEYIDENDVRYDYQNAKRVYGESKGMKDIEECKE